MRHAPQSAKSTQVIEWDEGRRRAVVDELAVEEPLEIRVNGQAAGITMRTPGDDFDLAAGFLLTEGIVTRRQAIERIVYGSAPDGQISGNRVDVALVEAGPIDVSRLERVAAATSSCGVCGRTSIDTVHARGLTPPNAAFTIDADRLTDLPAVLRSSQRVFGRTGGLHAAALFDAGGAMIALREDVGRHNAVDKVLGFALMHDMIPLSSHVLLVSGRLSFEIMQKALAGRVPIVAAVSAPSSLAVEFAEENGQTLVGFLRDQRMNVYSHAHRIQF